LMHRRDDPHVNTHRSASHESERRCVLFAGENRSQFAPSHPTSRGFYRSPSSLRANCAAVRPGPWQRV
jgi:hypothetical protein